jgi:hypothetical protein
VTRSSLLLVAGALLLAAAPVSAQYDTPLFSTLTSPTEITEAPASLLLMDVDGDGRKDALTGLWFALGLARADATGGFAPVGERDESHGFQDMAAADVDGDGDQDLLYTNTQTFVVPEPTGVMVNNGSGSFLVQEIGTNQPGDDLAAGDLDGDGDPDVVVVAADGDVLGVSLGGSGASFGPFSTFNVGEDPLALRLGDVNGDGDLDVAVARKTGASVHLGDGLGGLGPPRPVNTMGNGQDVALLDMDADGLLDIAISNASNNPNNAGWLATARGHGDGLFDDPVTWPLAYDPTNLLVADFDGDGNEDLVASSNLESVGILFSDGLGGFAAPELYAKAYYGDVVDVDDRNGDGAPDLVQAGLHVFLEMRNDGTGTLVGPRAYQQGLQPQRAATGDLDGDGLVDALGPWLGSAAVGVHLGDGAGGLAPAVSWPVGSFPRDAALGDLDQDGDLDAVVTEAGAARLLLVPNDGAGGFPSWSSYNYPLTELAWSPQLADLDGDGLLDVAAAVDSDLLLAWGDGAGGFSSATSVALGISTFSGVTALVLGDLEGDGDLDAVVGGAYFDDVAVLLGDGSGGFQLQPLLSTGYNGTLDLELGDVDGDGHLDLLTQSQGSDLVLALAGDGVGGFGVPTSVPTLGDPSAIEAGDFDGDGLDDLAVFPDFHLSYEMALHFGQAGGGLGEARYQVACRGAWDATAADLTGDGRPELLVSSQFDAHVVVRRNLGGSPWTSVPGGVAGKLGEPLLDGSGSLVGGEPLRITLSRALPGTPTTLVLGVDVLGAPFKGGTLVPDPLLLLSLPSDAWGYVVIDDVWPLGLPSGLDLVMQDWFADPVAVKKFAASNGVVGTTP